MERLGYTVEMGCTKRPGDRDILCSWNRIREAGPAADAFEAAGLPVLITENASWGNEFGGGHWLTMARSYHNVSGMFPIGDSDRWDGLGIKLAPWRTKGETVILPQRGIGPRATVMPYGWANGKVGRLRAHPGRFPGIPLEQDLAGAGKVMTWGSGAAIKALILGIPVESDMPNWIGEQDNTDAGRLAMFRSLAWAQWRLEEIRSGEAFGRLLESRTA